MTAVFNVGSDGNGIIYYGKSRDEIADIVGQYEDGGWEVSLTYYDRNDDTLWYRLD